jgi:phosphoribosylaminoimidazolecarboxamide formyltransferase/IMP cyclohydrolase
MEVMLKYGLNPHQKNAKLVFDGHGKPLKVVNGTPGYINLLDAFGAWQLVKELKAATGKAAAASFKHVSPAGAAVAKALDDRLRRSQMIPEGEKLSPVACAYARARAGDRMCSFGDFAAVSEPVDATLAKLLAREVSDGIIAPGYEADALSILTSKKGGKFLALEIDPAHAAPATDCREVMGFKLYQDNNKATVDPKALGTIVGAAKDLPAGVAESLAVATIALKYTQSNSVCVAYDGQVIGMGAGQQSRVHCTRLCCGKADKWFCQQHPRVLELKFKDGLGRVEKTNAIDQFLLWDELADAEVEQMLAAFAEKPTPLSRRERADWIASFEGVALSSDAFIPFRDTLDRASRSNVKYVLQAGGSLRDDVVTAAADQYGMVMIHSGVRWFTH